MLILNLLKSAYYVVASDPRFYGDLICLVSHGNKVHMILCTWAVCIDIRIQSNSFWPVV